MIRRRIKLYSYHTFLVIPFIVLFLYGYNLGETRPAMTYRTLFFGMAASVILFAIFYLLIGSRLKTGVFVTVLLFSLFQYGVLYEFFETLYYKGSWPFSNIHRYLLTVYIIILGGFFWFIKKSPHDFIRINYFLNILIIILIIYNLFRINNRHFYPSAYKESKPETRDSVLLKSNDKVDIYHIVLDGYASNNVLKKYYNFDNSIFTNTLKKLNFNFSDSAFSNYYYTSPSLCSSLNMRYLAPAENLNQSISENLVFSSLKSNGYRIYHMFSGYAVTSTFKSADSTVFIDGPNEFEKSLLKYTILRLDDLIGLFAHQRLKSQFAKMMDLAELGHSPKFCFMHFVAPHPPFIFDRDGRIRTKHQFAEHSWEPRNYYVDQLVYVNRQITNLVYRIISMNPRATIIIQSDHGPWITSESPANVFEARSGIIYAVHAPAAVKIPDRTSSVNTFRYIFNGLFNAGLPVLKDEFAGKGSLLNDPILLKKVDQH
jgi:hypothetical protein